jgi:2-haloacid dehalogenase
LTVSALRRGVTADWTAIADGWRAAYAPSMSAVLDGRRPWANLEILQRESLEQLVADHSVAGLTPADLDEINLYWRRGRPWPDSRSGLRRLKARFTIGALSNGNVALLVEMAKRGGLPWDMVFSTELFKSYKPAPATYLGACGLLGLQPGQVMLCAAHNGDLAAAHAMGLKTAFIARPRENGAPSEAVATGPWDYAATSMADLANQLGA